jgi:hypothetical protein
LSALMQELPQGLPVVHWGLVDLAGAVVAAGRVDEPIRHTLDALMQVLPQGMPFVQFF